NDALSERNRGSLLVEIQPFPVVTDEDIILLDTGLGLADEEGQLQIYKNLRRNGINAGEVTKVIMSHLHKDHAGGMINPYTRQLTFENAVYHIQKQEIEEAVKNSSSYDKEVVDQLIDSDNIVLEEADRGVIAPDRKSVV